MPNRLGGEDPTKYLGVRAANPPNVITSQRAPTTGDTKHDIGTLWIFSPNSLVYELVKVENSLAVWVQLGLGEGASISSTGELTLENDLILNGDATHIQMQGGAATDFIGQATLASGTVTVANTNIAAGDRIFLTRADPNSSSALGELTITALTASTSFVITALDPADGSTTITGDTSIVNYVILREI